MFALIKSGVLGWSKILHPQLQIPIPGIEFFSEGIERDIRGEITTERF
jgi:hypothetical protein